MAKTNEIGLSKSDYKGPPNDTLPRMWTQLHSESDHCRLL